MEVIDSQVHIWLPDRPDRPWSLGAHAHLPEPITYEKLSAMMADAGVDRAILVPPGWEGDRLDYCLQAAAKYPNRFAVVGPLQIVRPESRQLIETWLDQPGMLGIRLTLPRDKNPNWFTEGAADWFWPAAERLGIPVMVNAPNWIKEVGTIAARHPGLRIIVDHMGLRDVKDDAIAPAVANTVALAQLSNVHIKMTLVPSFSSAPYPYRNIHSYLRQLIEAFGPRRCFWGADLSSMLIRSACSYRQAVTLFTEELDFLSHDDRTWIMGRGIAECLGWPGAQ